MRPYPGYGLVFTIKSEGKRTAKEGSFYRCFAVISGTFIHHRVVENFLNTIIIVYTALFPICNPLGVAPIFLTITRGEKSQRRRQQALKGSIFVFFILTTFLLAGSFILKFFGISLDGVRIAGGLVVTGIGLRLLHQTPTADRQSIETEEAMEKSDISFSPLALPLLAGPGTIAVVMTKSSQFEFDFLLIAAAIVAILLLSATCWLILSQADRILEAIGITGANILTKIMAFLLVCIGVQLFLSGTVHILHSPL
ncbi:MAG: stress protection protein MarC [Verrucomicrobia bacterium]|nr:MAG: stress protection protein MarC [Verrucomicrobiota bacterium]